MQICKFVAPELIFGRGSLAQVGKAAKRLGARRPLVVSDPGVIAAGWLETMLPYLEEEGLDFAVWAEVTPNPKDFEIEMGVRRYHEHGSDALIVLGGGSCIDAAKGVALVSSNGGRIHDFEGVNKIRRPLPPMIAAPTTGGTGADVSQFAIITDTSRQIKMALVSKSLIPDISITDPLLLTSKEPRLTASTGIDALAHAIESYVSLAATFLTEVQSLQAIRLIMANLRASFASNQALEAKEKMACASLHAGLAFSNAILGAAHAMAHQVGGLLDSPHGELNAILLPYVMEYNLTSCPERFAKIAEVMGLPVAGLSAIEAGQVAIDAVRTLASDVGVTYRLADLGVRPALIDTLATNAMQDACMSTNPRKPTHEEIVALLSAAL